MTQWTYRADLEQHYAEYVKHIADLQAARDVEADKYGRQSTPYAVNTFKQWMLSRLPYMGQAKDCPDDWFDFDLVYQVSCP